MKVLSKINKLKFLKSVFSLIIVFGIIRYINTSWQASNIDKIQFDLGFLSSSLTIFMLSYLLFASGWQLIIKILGVDVYYKDAFKVAFASQLGKYVPGGIWAIAGKALLCKQLNLSKSTITLSMMLETGLSVSGATLAALLSFIFIKDSIINPYILSILILAFLAFFNKSFLNFCFNKLAKILKKDFIEFDYKFSQILQILLFYLANWLIIGIAFYLYVNAITPLGKEYIFYCIAAYSLAVVGGLAVLFVPAGIGVREGILIFFLQALMPLGVATIIAFSVRFLTTLIEIIFSIIATFIKSRPIT